jgi:hypothetical protein
MNDKDASKFTCNKCGSHELTVTHIWNIQAGNASEKWQEWGPLKENHHWQYEFKEKVEEHAEGDVQRGDFGEFEEDDSVSEPEAYEIYEEETDRENDDFLVHCGNCDREIEFGWSQPYRHGLIFPVEFSDFDALESWPDPKYVDVWQQRGWFRTGHIQP